MQLNRKKTDLQKTQKTTVFLASDVYAGQHPKPPYRFLHQRKPYKGIEKPRCGGKTPGLASQVKSFSKYQNGNET